MMTAEGYRPQTQMEHRYREIRHLKVSGIEEQGDWYLLPGTGFNVRMQVNLLQENLLKGIREGRSRETVLAESFQQIGQDIQGFKTEYLCQELLFPIVLDKKVVNGRERIIAPMYGGKLLVDTTSDRERQGKVKKTVTQVEDFLLNAAPGSIACMSSPPGDSGFDGVTYQDTQTYIWMIQPDGKPRGFTVRTDMDIDQNKRLLARFGIDRTKLDGRNTYDEVSNIVDNPVFLHATPDKKYNIEDIVDTIRDVKGTDVAYQGRSFKEIYTTLKNPYRLWTLDAKTQELVHNLEETIRFHIENGGAEAVKNIEIALGTTVLKLAEYIRMPKIGDRMRNRAGERFNPYALLRDVQRLPGCNGGGGLNNTIIFGDSLSPRLASQEFFTCPKCPYKASGPIGNKCPGCGLTKEAYSEESGITCD